MADDDSTVDPEVTSAASGSWLAELRAQASNKNQSVRDLLANEPDDVDDEHADHSDATVAPDSDTMDTIRDAVAAARAEAPASSTTPHSPVVPTAPHSPVVPTAPNAPVGGVAPSRPADTAPPASTAPRVDSTPPVEQQPHIDAPSRPSVVAPQLPRLDAQAAPTASPGGGVRWEAPARLAPAIEVERVGLRPASAGKLPLVWIAAGAALAIIVALLVVIVLLTRGDSTPSELPERDLIIDEENAPIEQGDETE